MDGVLRAADTLTVPVSSSAGFFGITLFEGVRAYRTAWGHNLFRLGDHVERLGVSCRTLGVELPVSLDEVGAWCESVVRANSGAGDLHLRVAVALLGGGMSDTGPASVYVLPRAMGRMPQADMGVRMRSTGMSLASTGVEIRGSKVGAGYLASRMALLDARQAGFDDALFLDPAGYVTEATGANVFCVCDTLLRVPPASVGLAGCTRDTLLRRIGPEVGLRCAEGPMDLAELYLANEVFLAGTGVEILPVVEVDGRAIGDGRPGPWTRALWEAYIGLVRGGRVEDAPGWIREVRQ